MPEIPPAGLFRASRERRGHSECGHAQPQDREPGAGGAVSGLVGCSDAAEPGPAASAGTAADETSAPPASFASVVTAVEDRVAVYDGIATGVIALVRVGDETEVVTGGLADVDAERAMDPA